MIFNNNWVKYLLFTLPILKKVKNGRIVDYILFTSNNYNSDRYTRTLQFKLVYRYNKRYILLYLYTLFKQTDRINWAGLDS